MSAKVEAPPESVGIADPGGNGPKPDQAMQDVKEEPPVEAPALQQNHNDISQKGGVGSVWHDGHESGKNGNQYDESAAEPDSHGTGIKEDG